MFTKMSSKSLYFLAVAAVSQAATPEGFEPASETNLLVSFGAAAAENGNVLAKSGEYFVEDVQSYCSTRS